MLHLQGGHLQRGPSPILASWLEFSLQPARIPSLQSLRTGVSPLLLPPVRPHGERSSKQGHRATDGDNWTVEGLRLNSANSWLPNDDVLRRSEFLNPLDSDTLQLYRSALAM